jgi:hypothetical protein
MCIESDGQKTILPVCPIHLSPKVRFGSFGTGMIVTCHEERNHLVRLCDTQEFEAERKEAQSKLCPGPIIKTADSNWS